MALHAELMERRLEDGDSFVRFRIFDDDPNIGDIGEIELVEGTPADMKSELRAEAQRLKTLPVGKIIDL